jgi:hypothetical protein
LPVDYSQLLYFLVLNMLNFEDTLYLLQTDHHFGLHNRKFSVNKNSYYLDSKPLSQSSLECRTHMVVHMDPKIKHFHHKDSYNGDNNLDGQHHPIAYLSKYLYKNRLS